MNRISTNMMNDDMQYQLRNREAMLNDMQNKIASQRRILNLRDDPAAAANSTRYQSYLARLSRYTQNIQSAMDKHQTAEGYMREAVDIMQRVRELAVQGANGTYTKDDLQNMGQEVNQLLGELVKIGNARSPDGTMIFAGLSTRSQPFRMVSGNVPGADGQVATNIEYVGDIGHNRTDISDVATANLNFPGNQVFWAEHQQIIPSVNATSYVVQQDSTIYIDNVPIDLKAGDNVYAIMQKINDSAAAVKASLDPVSSAMVLQSTTPHQIWLEDGPGGTVLKDLGIVNSTNGNPPHNIANGTRVYGGSLFDMVMRLRDALYSGNTLDVGGSALRGIDSGLNNLLSNLGRLGAESERLDLTLKRTESEIPDVTGQNSHLVDLDMTKAITDLRMLEYTHQAALQTAARILPPTLLDFMR
ncbi:flagellar hook-associated protein 3 [Salinispira pacifica]